MSVSSSSGSNRSSSSSPSSSAGRSSASGSGNSSSKTSGADGATAKSKDGGVSASGAGSKGASEASTGASKPTDGSSISAEASQASEPSASVDAISRGLGADQSGTGPSDAKDAKAAESQDRLGEALGKETLRSGMTSEAVGALQQGLNDRLGLSLETDGKFGQKTADAVRAFQTQEGLKPDGVVGPKTREALLSTGSGSQVGSPEAKAEAASGEEAQDVKATEPRDAREYAALDEALGDKTLSTKARDPKAVSALQDALNDVLGAGISVDGKFGQGTADAVKAFQESQGLKADGIVGKDTREALLGPKPPATREQLQDREAARRQAAAEKKPDLIFGDKISTADQAKVREIAKELQAQPNDLMSVFHVETAGSLSPSQRTIGNPNGAVGLIQFTGTAITAMNKRRAAQGLEPLSKEKLAGMSFSEQLDHVRDYLRDTLAERGATGPVDRGDLYSAVFAPALVGASDGAGVYKSGTKAYSSNASLDTNGDGWISKAEVTARVDDAYQLGMSQLGD